MIRHPDERRLLAYHEGRLRDRERRRIAGHLADCQRCRSIIQGHRAVRAVLRLEAPPAPGGVLERALSTRAAGGAMVLPAADQARGRRLPPGAIALLAGAAALALLSVVRVVPMPVQPLTDTWDWWSRTVAAWQPFGGSDGIRIPEVLRAPVAAPAVVHPERLRPMTVIYQQLVDRPEQRSPMVYVRAFSLESAGAPGQPWRLTSTTSVRITSSAALTFDPRTLAVRSWADTSTMGTAPNAWQYVTAFTWDGDSMHYSAEYLGNPLAHVVRNKPPGRGAFALDIPRGAVLIQGRDQMIAAMTTVDLHEGWSGSFAEVRRNPLGHGPPFALMSLYVTGSDSVTVPAGTFDAWRMRQLSTFGETGTTFWFRKSDGLLVRELFTSGSGSTAGRELLSVSHP